ncbi:MAG: AMP-binding protein [Bdellovibrionales bacterium]|nr:AMP-binding protein [Bdellovibrionales bacterium]
MQSIAYSKTIGEAFLRRYQQNGARMAYMVKKDGAWRPVTYAENYQTVRRLTCGLMNLGVKKGERVSILANTSLAWTQFDMAILGSGGITVPIYPTNTPEDCAYILNHAEIGTMFVDDYKNLLKIASISSQCPALKTVIVSFDVSPKDVKGGFQVIHWNKLHDDGLNSEGKFGHRFEENLKGCKPDDVFTICYTSGTTGLPKGVVLTHDAIVSTMEDTHKVIVQPGFATEEELLLAFLPMSHILGKWESLLPHFLGWSQAFAESLDTLLANLGEVKPTLWVSVPRVFEKAYSRINTMALEGPPVKKAMFQWAVKTGKDFLAALDKGSVPPMLKLEYALASKVVFSKIKARFGGRLKFCVSGSAPLSPDIQRFFTAAGIIIYEGYGLTETCAPVSVNLPNANRVGSVGKLMPEVLCRIAEDGEILLKSRKCVREYYKNPDATAESLRDGWFYTGDIARMDEDGYFFIVDRKKDMILVSGFNVYPNEIEAVVAMHPGVLEVAAVGVPDQKSGEAVKIFVVKKDAELTADVLIAHCRQQLTGYKVPSQVEFRNDLPKTNVGKILRRELRDEERKKVAA